MYFVNSLLVMCGIACGMPLLFIANRLSRKFLARAAEDIAQQSIEMMRERNRIDLEKVHMLERLAVAAERER